MNARVAPRTSRSDREIGRSVGETARSNRETRHDGETGKAFAKKFQIGGLSRDKLYQLAKSEESRIIYLHVAATEKEMPKTLHVSLDGRSGARVRELDLDLAALPVNARTAKGVTVTKWTVKDVKAMLAK